MNSLENWLIELGSLCFSVAVDGLVPMGYEVLAVALVDLSINQSINQLVYFANSKLKVFKLQRSNIIKNYFII